MIAGAFINSRTARQLYPEAAIPHSFCLVLFSFFFQMSEDSKLEHDDSSLHVAARMPGGLVFLKDHLLVGFALRD